ncbi:MAG TPA: tetratricopeptide repeat protein [Terriglobales bacterium]|nr:tetratricopeptide repeat protein [Terriglobales bacterium]
MRSSERHQLKENQFATATQEILTSASEHRTGLLYGGTALVVVLLLVFGGTFYLQNREQKASVLFGQGMQVYNAPVVAEGTPTPPGVTTFTSAEDRAKAASNKFVEVVNKYGRTDSGLMAKYFLGICAEDMKDNSKAEQYLKDVSDSRNKEVASLAKSALASLYHATGRDQQAMDIYKALIEKPTNTVPKASAQMALAEIYAEKDKTQAKILYEQIGKENPDSPITNIVNTRMAELK